MWSFSNLSGHEQTKNNWNLKLNPFYLYSYYIKDSKSVKTNRYLSLVSESGLFEDEPRDQSDFKEFHNNMKMTAWHIKRAPLSCFLA